MASAENCASLLSNFSTMKKLFLFFLCCMMAAVFVSAQSEELILKPGSKGFYVEHKVTPKENFYSIGRLFNVSPKHLASFNSLDMSKGLSIGQTINIPLSDTNFSQKVNEGAPVYVIAAEKEDLSKISRSTKASVEDLKFWNGISSDNVTKGTRLIAGFLTSGEMANSNKIVIAKNEAKKDLAVNEKMAETKAGDKTETIKETAKTETEKQKAVEPTVRPEEKKTLSEERPVNISNGDDQGSGINTSSGKGYFRNDFDQQIKTFPLSKEQTLTSGIFKTMSGWVDEKYYALMDDVDPGTVIMVTNPDNNKSVFAKVLGAMKGIRQNQGLELRLSDAAVSRLDIKDTNKFIVKVNY